MVLDLLPRCVYTSNLIDEGIVFGRQLHYSS